MAGLVVVDTDLLIDFLRGKGPGVGLLRQLLSGNRLRVTAITAFELRVGADFLPRRDDILRLLISRTLPLGARAALRGGGLAAQLRSQGREIGFADCLQAGICLDWDLPFATRNTAHFARVDGLRLFDLDKADL